MKLTFLFPIHMFRGRKIGLYNLELNSSSILFIKQINFDITLLRLEKVKSMTKIKRCEEEKGNGWRQQCVVGNWGRNSPGRLSCKKIRKPWANIAVSWDLSWPCNWSIYGACRPSCCCCCCWGCITCWFFTVQIEITAPKNVNIEGRYLCNLLETTAMV